MIFKGLLVFLGLVIVVNAGRLSYGKKAEKKEPDSDATTKSSEYNVQPGHKVQLPSDTSTETIEESEPDDSETTKDSNYNVKTTTENKSGSQVTKPSKKIKPSKNEDVSSTEPSDEISSTGSASDDTTTEVSAKTSTEESEGPVDETEPSSEEPTSELPKQNIPKKCNIKKAQVLKLFEQWCQYFEKQQFDKFIESYTDDGYIMVLSDIYKVHDKKEFGKFIKAAQILQETFSVKKCSDIIDKYDGEDCDPKTHVAKLNAHLLTKYFNPPISGSLTGFVVEVNGQPKFLNQSAQISDE